MITKVLFFTDVHYRGTTPGGRKDDYPAAIRGKLEQIRDIGNSNGVDAFIEGGDTFDMYGPAYSVVYELAEIYKTFPAPIYKVWGSHEVVGYNYNRSQRKRTASGLLDVLGAVHTLDKPVIICRGDPLQGDPSIWLGGVHHLYETYETDTFDGFEDTDPPLMPYLAVAAVHGMITRASVVGPHTLVQNAEVGPAKIVLSGHNHTPFEHHRKRDDVLFINPGSVARVDNVKSERERIPQVVLLSYDGEEYNVEYVPLEVADGDDVFVGEPEETPLNEGMEAFFEKLQSIVYDLEGSKVRDRVVEAMEKAEITEGQRELGIDILNEVEA